MPGKDFERVERELHERFVAAEREVLGELLERLDVDLPPVELGRRRYHRVLRSAGRWQVESVGNESMLSAEDFIGFYGTEEQCLNALFRWRWPSGSSARSAAMTATAC